MSEQPLASLLGMQSTKAPRTSNTQKTSGNSLQTKQSENGFHARLLNSMKDASTQDTTHNLSPSPVIYNRQNPNQIEDKESLGLSNINIDGIQIQLNPDVPQNITTAANTDFITNNDTNGEPATTQTQISALSDNVHLYHELKESTKPDPNLFKVLNIPTITVSDNSNTKQSGLKGNSSPFIATDLINSNASTANVSASTSAQIQTSKLLDNAKPNQESDALIEPRSNLLKVLKEATGLTDNTPTITNRTSASTQVHANISRESILLGSNGPKTIVEQDSNMPDNLKTNQNSKIVSDQNISGDNSNKVTQRIGSGTNSINTLFETNSIHTQPESAAPSKNHSDTINSDNIKSITNNGKVRPRPAHQGSGSVKLPNAIFETKESTTNSSATNFNSFINSEESGSRKVDQILKEQQSDKISSANTNTKLATQQDLGKIDSSINESSIIFNTNSNPTETNLAKSYENTTITNNNGVNTGDATTSANSSSDNSSLNNQGSDFQSELNINTVKTGKNAGLETNFTDTLSQVNNASKPLGAIGNDVADNIIQSAKLYMDGGKSEIKLQLNPPELGTLKLEFTIDDDILDAKITVERSAVKDIIEKDIPRLRELISGSDIDVGKFDISHQENESNRFGFKDKNPQPGAEKGNTEDSSNLENEEFEKETDEGSIADNTDSKQINYLV